MLGITMADAMNMANNMGAQGWNAIKNNPGVSVPVGALAFLGVAALAYRLSTKTEEDPEVERQQRIKAVLNRLLITEYHLPRNQNEKRVFTSENRPQPMFDDKTKKEIAIVATMIQKAVERKAPLPNVILKGLPGVGKTMLGEALCDLTGIGFIRIPSGIWEKHLKNGNHINAHREVMQIVDESPVNTYLLYDDGEELFARRDTGEKVASKVDPKDVAAAPWLAEHEKMTDIMNQRRTALVNAHLEDSGRAIRNGGFIVTTNRPDRIEPAFSSRCRVIHIGTPGKAEIKQIIMTHLPSVHRGDQNMLSFYTQGVLEDMSDKMAPVPSKGVPGFRGRDVVKTLEDVDSCVRLEGNIMSRDIIDAAIHARRQSIEKEMADPRKGPGIATAMRQLLRSVFSSLAAAFAG
jgi:SpoVK/Ycf46/Vps4 family AAA+-type ATPase